MKINVTVHFSIVSHIIFFVYSEVTTTDHFCLYGRFNSWLYSVIHTFLCIVGNLLCVTKTTAAWGAGVRPPQSPRPPLLALALFKPRPCTITSEA